MQVSEQRIGSHCQGSTKAATWLMGLAVAIVVVGFSAIIGNVLLEMRRSDWQMARQATDNLVATIEADVARNLELYELSLQAVVDGMNLPEITQVSKHIRHLILFDRAATAKHIGSIQVFDPAGDLIIDSTTLGPAPANGSQEEYFTIHMQDPNIGLFVSRPVVRDNGEFVVVLSRRLVGRDGSFGGVVAGAMRISYFHDLLRRVDLGPDGSMSVMRRDGTVLVRSTFDLEKIGSNRSLAEVTASTTVMLRDGAVLMRSPLDVESIGTNQSFGEMPKQSLAGRSGWYEMTGVVDGIERLYVWRAGAHPLVISAGKSLNDIYRAWRAEAVRIGFSILALSILAGSLTLFLAREFRRRSAVEAKLATLAVTDELTGLNNRRRFDEAIQSEWRRSMRQRTQIALLMIDVDHFKSYNDRFGHQAGDKVLAEIAACIASSARRAADLTARYGGEEFAVLLPGLSDRGAFHVAERIRKKVECLPSEGTVSTVSIGYACLTPTADLDARDLIGAADAALYKSKALGRNQVHPKPQQQDCLAA